MFQRFLYVSELLSCETQCEMLLLSFLPCSYFPSYFGLVSTFIRIIRWLLLKLYSFLKSITKNTQLIILVWVTSFLTCNDELFSLTELVWALPTCASATLWLLREVHFAKACNSWLGWNEGEGWGEPEGALSEACRLVMRDMMLLPPRPPRPGTLVSPAQKTNIAMWCFRELRLRTQTTREKIYCLKMSIYSLLLHTFQ